MIQERNADKLCGYPLCSQPLPSQKGKYKISRSQFKVFDTTELQHYCSEECFLASRYLMQQLPQEPLYLQSNHSSQRQKNKYQLLSPVPSSSR